MTSLPESATKRKRAAQFAICDGRERLGSVEQTDDAFVAFNRRGQVLGRFASPDDAIAAIIDIIAGREA
jgi:hypothetical protein